jgi:hypothetical protein
MGLSSYCEVFTEERNAGLGVTLSHGSIHSETLSRLSIHQSGTDTSTTSQLQQHRNDSPSHSNSDLSRLPESVSSGKLNVFQRNGPPPPASQASKPLRLPGSTTTMSGRSSAALSRSSSNTNLISPSETGDKRIQSSPCGTCGCDSWAENVFKKGQCRNCYHPH